MRCQVLFFLTIGAALIVPALAIHIGGFIAYIGAATVFSGIGVLWRRAISRERQEAELQGRRDEVNGLFDALRSPSGD